MQPRYSATNQALHWITVLLVLAVLPLAWVMASAKPGPLGEAAFNWHKTLGGLVLLITLWRIVRRFRDGPPPYPPVVAAWEKGVSHAVYWLFFFILLWMPVTGFLATTFEGNPTKLFNLIPTPQILPVNKHLGHQLGDLHVVGQWAVYGLILLHVAAVAFHLIWAKDGVLGRMLPANAAEPPPA